MRRFVTLVILLLFSIPFGVSISGCSKTVAPVFCNGGDSGVTTGQVTTISLQPIVFGISLNFAEIGQLSSPGATDCKGSSASVQAYVYGTTDMTIADVQPNQGRICAGTWNRNTGGGIPDYTFCIPTNKTGTAYISASAEGVTSNPIPIFVHPVVTSIVLGGPSSNCTTDPTTACCPLTTVGSATAPPYLANSCLSQGTTAQLVARIFAGTGANQTNISCQAGHLQFTSQGASSQTAVSPVVSIDSNGVATANQPGSVLISANISNAASSAGFFSTCPPASITLTAPGTPAGSGTPANPVAVNQNNTQPLLATSVDTKGITLTGLSLEYVSTAPTTIPAGDGSVNPPLAGNASISAICQPPSCNSSAYNQIGLFGNGNPVTSNSVAFTSPGTNSTVLYMASTQSLYVETRDFTQTALAAPFLLPFAPNSMVISNDGSTIYMGSATALMVLNAINTLSISRVDTTSPGTVLAVSPNSSEIVISDPVKQTTTIENTSGGVVTTFGGVGTHAEFSADGQTLYVAAGNQLLIFSAYTGWTNVAPATTAGTPVTDVAVTVPGVGAYFAGPTTTARSYCPITTPTSTPTIENNIFFPPADSSAAITDRIAATNDGLHILGATVTPAPTLNDLRVQIPAGNLNGPSVSITCPATGTLAFSNTVSPILLTKISASAITGVLPTSDSTLAVVTYTGSGGVLPAYALSANGPGTTTYIKLSGTAIAPVEGVISADNSTIFAGTTGDNLVHLITRSTLTDTSTLAPNLTNPAGVTVPVNLMVQKPRRTT
jgi:trimeric autotransporter adhesin